MNDSAHQVFNVFYYEIQALCTTIVDDCQSIFDKFKSPSEEESGYMIVDTQSQYFINSIIVNASNLRKIFITDGNKSKFESKKQFNNRIERAKYFKEVFNFNEYDALNNRTVRNAIEHFDERINTLSLSFEEPATQKNKMDHILYNITLSSKRIFSGNVYYLKSYIVEDKLAIIDNNEISIDKIQNEANDLLAKINEILDDPKPGGLMIIPKSD